MKRGKDEEVNGQGGKRGAPAPHGAISEWSMTNGGSMPMSRKRVPDEESCDVGSSAGRVKFWSDKPARHDIQSKMSVTGKQRSLKRTGPMSQTQSEY